MRPRINFVYVYTERGLVLGYVQARCRWQRRDEWTITTLAATDKDPERVWERLLEEVCRAAGEEGVIRVFVKVPKDEPQLNTFRSTRLHALHQRRIWGNLYFGQNSGAAQDDPYSELLRRRESRDAWDLMQLYSAVTPPVVQRAEMLTTRQWHLSHLPRPWFLSPGLLEHSYVWQDESGKTEGLGGYVRLLTGARGHWITILFRPDPGQPRDDAGGPRPCIVESRTAWPQTCILCTKRVPGRGGQPAGGARLPPFHRTVPAGQIPGSANKRATTRPGALPCQEREPCADKVGPQTEHEADRRR